MYYCYVIYCGVEAYLEETESELILFPVLEHIYQFEKETIEWLNNNKELKIKNGISVYDTQVRTGIVDTPSFL